MRHISNSNGLSKKSSFLVSLLMSCTASAFAGEMGAEHSYFKGHWTIQGGAFWANQGALQTIGVRGLVGEVYRVSNKTPVNGLAGLGYYLNGFETNSLRLAYGLNAFYLAPTSVNGTVQVENIFNNMAYSYKVQHVPVYAAAKTFIKTNNSKYDLTFDLGVGPNFMQVGSYKEKTLSNSEAMNNFKSHNNVTFSLTLGAGVQLNDVLGKFPLECGYRFYYLGQGQLTANNTLFTNTLKTGEICTNALVCAVTI